MCDDMYCEGHETSIPPKDDDAWLERVEELAEQHPIPSALRALIEDQIEPVTMNTGLEHDDTMSAIEAAYPVIFDYLGHGSVAASMIRHFAPEEE